MWCTSPEPLAPGGRRRTALGDRRWSAAPTGAQHGDWPGRRPTRAWPRPGRSPGPTNHVPFRLVTLSETASASTLRCSTQSSHQLVPRSRELPDHHFSYFDQVHGSRRRSSFQGEEMTPRGFRRAGGPIRAWSQVAGPPGGKRRCGPAPVQPPGDLRVRPRTGCASVAWVVGPRPRAVRARFQRVLTAPRTIGWYES
jgi:hypothetical protein